MNSLNVKSQKYSCEQQYEQGSQDDKEENISWITKQALYHVGTVFMCNQGNQYHVYLLIPQG